jgi:hypothetical protein
MRELEKEPIGLGVWYIDLVQAGYTAAQERMTEIGMIKPSAAGADIGHVV